MKERCKVCNWPLANSREEGCVPGDCSYRPDPGSSEWYRIKENLKRIEVESKQEAAP